MRQLTALDALRFKADRGLKPLQRRWCGVALVNTAWHVDLNAPQLQALVSSADRGIEQCTTNTVTPMIRSHRKQVEHAGMLAPHMIGERPQQQYADQRLASECDKRKTGRVGIFAQPFVPMGATAVRWNQREWQHRAVAEQRSEQGGIAWLGTANGQ